MSGDGGSPPGYESVFLPAATHGFGTMRLRRPDVRRGSPESASARGYLRDGLPEIYRDGDFGMRFVGALETLLDPIVAVLDGLPAHFSADLAPDDLLELITAWLGIELRESQPTDERREIVRHAMELSRLRGTRPGIELALRLAFPGVPFRVEEPGSVSWGTDPAAVPEAPPPSLIVYCDVPLETERAAAAARLIEQLKPAHINYRLRVKSAPKPAEGG
jgi:phage tail-like protein